MLSSRPEGVGVGRSYLKGLRHAIEQQAAFVIGQADGLQPVGVRQQAEIALVRIQRVSTRMRRHHRRIGKIRGTQGSALLARQGKIGQTVVHQIDGPTFVAQRFPVEDKILGRHDERV